ncbi:MAG: LacI family DNA-binding transcriptional regulator [Thermosphaera sp.]
MVASRRWKVPTIEDVASHAGVSISTVSRVLNRSTHKVNAHTRELVLRAVKELNYRPNAVARSLIQGQTKTLGVLIPDISNPYYSSIVHGIETAALAAGYAVFLCNTDRNPKKQRHYVRILQEKRIEGVIAAGGAVADEDLGFFDDMGVPLVSIGSTPRTGAVVEVNNAFATYQLTKYLMEQGHERVAFIAGPISSVSSKARIEGCRAALGEQGGILPNALIKHGTWRSQSGYELARQLLEKAHKQFSAIIVANDLMALGVLRALYDRRVQVPDVLSVAGHDDIPEASFTVPSLTTMRIPSCELGSNATTVLIDLIERGGVANKMTFEAELVRRESTGPPP